MSSPKFAVIGMGYIFPRHAASINETGGEITMCCDTDSRQHLNDFPCYSHYKFLSADPQWDETDYVAICTPNDTHAEMALWCVGQGKKVLCEKPFTFDLDRAQRYQGLESVFNVMQLRHHPAYAELMSLDRHNIRDMELYVRVRRNAEYWKGWKGDRKRSGGILFNLGVHYIDVLTQMFGLYSFRDFQKEVETERTVMGTLRFFGSPAIKVTVAIGDTDEGVDRYIKVNGKEYRFSNQENLSMEGLHTKVYEDLIKGEGVKIRDCIDTLRLCKTMTDYAGFPNV